MYGCAADAANNPTLTAHKEYKNVDLCQPLQVTMTKELKQLVATLSREANDAATEALVVAGSNALRGTGMLTRLDGGDAEVKCPSGVAQPVVYVHVRNPSTLRQHAECA